MRRGLIRKPGMEENRNEKRGNSFLFPSVPPVVLAPVAAAP
jgi:hypothetical protein